MKYEIGIQISDFQLHTADYRLPTTAICLTNPYPHITRLISLVSRLWPLASVFYPFPPRSASTGSMLAAMRAGYSDAIRLMINATTVSVTVSASVRRA